MFIYQGNKESILGSSFNRAISHMNRTQCGFITAFREYDSYGNELSTNEKRKRNKLLEKEIRGSGLTYIKAKGGFIENKGTELESKVAEDTFCVINNRYAPNDFIKLMVKWCGQFEQDSVLVTEPRKENESKKAINIIGTYYTANGQKEMTFDNATIQDAEEYFTNICGHDFVLSSIEVHRTEGHQIYGTTGRVMAIRDFQDLYPELCGYEKSTDDNELITV